MMKHDKCRTAATKAMAIFRRRNGYTTIMTIRSRPDGKYSISNMYGNVWGGKACCKWRARAKATKILAARDHGEPVHSEWDGDKYRKDGSPVR